MSEKSSASQPIFDWRLAVSADVVEAVEKFAANMKIDSPEELSKWLMDPHGGQQHHAVRACVAYLKMMYETFVVVSEMFDLWSPPEQERAKHRLRFTDPEDMLCMAYHLYLLNSYGVSGCVLECGSGAGFSACCLSHVCGRLGRRFVIADSFEGLPDVSANETFFRKGDYAFRKDILVQHLKWVGVPAAVERYVEGWFADSFVNWSQEIALLWLDVDLYNSASDALGHLFSHVNRKGAIFCHEYTDFYGQSLMDKENSVPTAVAESFRKSGDVFTTSTVRKYFGVFGWTSSVQMQSFRLINAMVPYLQGMDARSRAEQELRNCRTVRAAFFLKNALSSLRCKRQRPRQ